MTLVQSWIDSLTLFKPKNFQLFVVEMLRSLRETYKLMFKYFWWLFGAIILCYVIPTVLALPVASEIFSLQLIPPTYFLSLSYFLYDLLFLAVCFSARSSIEKKDWSYFGKLYKKVIIYWLFSFSFFLVLLLVKLFPALFGIIVNSFIVAVAFLFHFLSIIVFLILFFTDSDGGAKNFFISMWRTLKMVVFNFPLLVVIGISLYMPVFIVNKYIFISPLMEMLVGSLLLPIGVCTYANIYIKKLYDQSDLYPKPVQQ